MTARAVAGIVGLIVAVIAVCGGLVTAIFGGVVSAGCTTPLATGAATVAAPENLTPPVGGFSSIGQWNSEQVSNAAIVITTGMRMHVPVRGWVIAVATAMQESSLVNLWGGDRDSVGLFQQRPSQGWGSPEQLHTPTYAAAQFYTRLLAIPGWQTMPLTAAAQKVQRSAYPDAYAKWETDAGELVTTVGSGTSRTIPGDLEQCPVNCPEFINTDGQSGLDSGCVSESAVLARAATWLTGWDGGPVPYLSSGDPTTWFDGYRRDCSGFASMALGLTGPGLTTTQLAAKATPIPKTALRAGDLLINPAPDLAGHVVIFDQWTDASMSSYIGYEQSGDGGTHHRVIPYPYFGSYVMRPYRL